MKRALRLAIVSALTIAIIASLAYAFWWLEYGRYKAVVRAEDGTLVKVSGVLGSNSTKASVRTEDGVIVAEGYGPQLTLILKPPAKTRIVLKVKVEVENWTGVPIGIDFGFSDPSGWKEVWCPMTFNAEPGKWYTVTLTPKNITVSPDPLGGYVHVATRWFSADEVGWLDVSAVEQGGRDLLIRLYVEVVSAD
ncbi:MAG: hypothetical protein DRJ67_09940 [Thermoprotei archaeon]|nr:MAG: hypothetical protein DRJ67_09940 [Thermoprotei archaeon]